MWSFLFFIVMAHFMFNLNSMNGLGYVFISEHEDGTVTELESQDVTFLEGDFPCMGEIDRDLHLYEI